MQFSGIFIGGIGPWPLFGFRNTCILNIVWQNKPAFYKFRFEYFAFPLQTFWICNL